jgi:hypothetical protein
MIHNFDDFVVFSKIFDFVSRFILESKSSQMKASEEQPQIPNVYSSDNAGLGKLRYIAGRCVAKLSSVNKFQHEKDIQ